MNSSTSTRLLLGLLAVLLLYFPRSGRLDSGLSPDASHRFRIKEEPAAAGQTAETEKPEPLPADLQPGKPQEAEKVTVTTNLVNVDAVVYNKKTGQPQPRWVKTIL
jgi:hypothetical protein